MRHSAIPVASFVLIVVAAGVGCRRPLEPVTSAGELTSSEPEIKSVEVRAATFQETVEVPVTIESDEQTMAMSRVEGYVGEVYVDIGDQVAEDQVLARLEAPELPADVDRREKLVAKARADLDSRQAEVDQARAQRAQHDAEKQLRYSELKRITSLVNSGALTKEQLDESQFAYDAVVAALLRVAADVNAAEARLAGAQADIDVALSELNRAETLAAYLEIKAPFDGVITERMVDSGAFVRPPTSGSDPLPLLKIESFHKLRAVMMFPIEDAWKLDVGDAVKLHSIRGLKGKHIDGHIDRHARALHRGSRMMRAEADVLNPADELSGKRFLKPGDYGKATITLATHEDVPAVPVSALLREEDATYVMLVDAANTCHRSAVEVLLLQDGMAAVHGAVKVGQRVVTDGLESVKDGHPLSTDQ